MCVCVCVCVCVYVYIQVRYSEVKMHYLKYFDISTYCLPQLIFPVYNIYKCY